VGEAYRYLHDTNKDLWHKLYSHDDFHPSPHGTWLQACVLFCTCFPGNDADGVAAILPPMYKPEWWDKSRVMQPSNEPPLPRPTLEEAMELRRVAGVVCGAKPSEEDPKLCITKLSAL